MKNNVDIEELKKYYLDILHDYGVKPEEFGKSKKKVSVQKSAQLGKELMGLLTSKAVLNADQVKDLINKGADVNYKEETKGDFPLLVCARKNYDGIAPLLINAGADVNLTNNYGTTALMAAARHDNSKLCTVLLQLGADVNAVCSDGDTALFSAKMHGHDNIVKILLEHNAHLYHTNNSGQSILDVKGANSVVKGYLDAENKDVPTTSHDDAMKLIEEASKEIPDLADFIQTQDSQTKVEEETAFGCTREEFEKLYDENNGFNVTYPADQPLSTTQSSGGRQRTRESKSSQVNITEGSRKIVADILTKI